jgi:hypothetical protein
MTVGRYDSALNRLPRVLVHQHHGLVGCNFFLQGNQATKLADGMGLRSDDEFFARDRLAINPKGHRERNPGRSAPFYSSIRRNLHNTTRSWAGILAVPRERYSKEV